MVDIFTLGKEREVLPGTAGQLTSVSSLGCDLETFCIHELFFSINAVRYQRGQRVYIR